MRRVRDQRLVEGGGHALHLDRSCGERRAWQGSRGAGVVLSAFFCLCGLPTSAVEIKSGISPNVISLPSGPGSIEGLGDSFEPELNSGTANYQVVVSIPPGRGGFTPELVLQYNGGGSNDAFGLGWSMNTPYVQRQTEKGLPHYTMWPDGDGIDNDLDGDLDEYDEFDTIIYSSKEELVPVANGYWRLENESEFVRFRKEVDGWVATRRDGVVLRFGRADDSRVESGNLVFRWHLDSMVDPNGNAINFEYRKLDGSAQIYLSSIAYNQSGSDDAAMEVKFKYEPRPDVITDFRPRFELKTAYRCMQIAVLAGGESVRSYEIGYAAPSEWQPLSLLASVTEFDRDGVSSLPSTRFGYTGSDGAAPVVQPLDRAPIIDLNDSNIDLLDVNADGLPDILDTNRRPHAYYLNEGEDHTGEVRWSRALPMENSIGLDLGADDVRFADMNGDGRTDLINLYSQSVHYYSLEYSSAASAAWRREIPIQNAQFRFDDLSVKLQDVDHDKRIDVIQTAGQRLYAWINQGSGNWSGRYSWSLSGAQLQLDSSSSLLADMNGDRLLDLVYAAPGTLYYYPSTGFGEFGERITMRAAPTKISNANRLLIADVNSDGRGDLVYLGGSLEVWLNQGLDPNDHRQGVLASPLSVTSPLLNAFVAHRRGDINGNGSTDILILGSQNRLAFVDFSPGVQPNLLNSIENGIGGRTRIQYSSSVTEMVRDAADGQPWNQVIPFPVPVVSGMEVDDGSNTYRTEFAYRNGYYDPKEKEFRGFAEVLKTEIGDETAPTLVTKHIFDTGRNSEALKGKLLAVETRGPDGKLFFRERHDWSTRELAEGVADDKREVTYAFKSAKRLDAHEGLQSPVSARWDYEYDDYGNVTRVHEHGRLDPGWEDERVTETTYTSSHSSGLDSWILDRVVRRETLDPAGDRIAAQRTYYDGIAEPGVVSAGNPTRVEGWVDGSRWLDLERKDYDEFGNVVAIYDGEYRARSGGHFREVAYDPEFKTYPVREIVHTGNAAAPRLEMSATYDAGFGKVTSHTDFNGHLTTYSYDTFGRLTAVVKPGDSVERPTESYDYVLDHDAGDGIRVNWVETRKREQAGGGTLDSRSFFDGLGRKIMTREEDETPGRVVVTGTVQFNARSLPRRQYLPYFEDGTLEFADPSFRSAYMEHQYDALGRGIRITQPDSSFSSIEYEPFAKTVRDEEQTRPESMHFGAAHRFVVDGLQDEEGEGRLREVHEIVKIADDGRRSDAQADWTTRYDYDLLDNVVLITDSQGNRKRAAFDGLGRKVLDADPNRGSTTYRYDAASNLIETVDAKKQRITYEYDGANRLVAEDYHDEGSPFSANRKPDVRYAYDRSAVEAELADESRAAPRNTMGQLVSIYDLSGETHLSYDPRGRVEWQVKSILHPQTGSLESFASEMDYDSMDRVISHTYPDNTHISYSYNQRGLLEGIAGGSGSLLANLDYNSSGQFARMDHGNEVSTTYEYDERLRLKQLTAAKPGEAPLLSYAYRMDRASNIVGIDDLRPRDGVLSSAPQRINDQSFEYDDLYRLNRVRYGFEADVGEGAAGISYRYDRIGNLLEQSSNISHQERGRSVVDLGQFEYAGGRGERAARSLGEPPGPHATTGTSGRQLSYDENGNVVQLDDMQLTWDFKDRLVAVRSDRIAAEYVYDHNDRRVTKHVRHLDSEEAAEPIAALYVDQHYEVRDGKPVKHVFAGERRIARVSGSSDLEDQQDSLHPNAVPDIRYYHQDHLGSTNVTTDAVGNPLQEIAYYPYGQMREIDGRTHAESEPYKFSQKETDKETGLQYFEARYFDGAMARFLSVDPALRQLSPFEEPQRLNAYSYSLNRPLVYQDPTGEISVRESVSIGLDFTPGVSNLKSGVELITGIDPITGKEVSRLMAGIGLIPYGKHITKGAKLGINVSDKMVKKAIRAGFAESSSFKNMAKVRDEIIDIWKNPRFVILSRQFDKATGKLKGYYKNYLRPYKGKEGKVKLKRVTTSLDSKELKSVGKMKPKQVHNNVKSGRAEFHWSEK